MPSKKKKYNARFPAGRIKKIMQTDEEVGKVAQAVPVIISKALEMFIESLLKKSMQITQSRNAKTLTPSHMKQCILSESRFDFLKDLVKNVPDASIQEDNENNALAESNVNFGVIPEDLGSTEPSSCSNIKENITAPSANFYIEQDKPTTSSTSRTPVIKYGPKVKQENTKFNFSVNSLLHDRKEEPELHITIASHTQHIPPTVNHSVESQETIPTLVSVSRNIYGQSSTGDNLCIDEDYDN